MSALLGGRPAVAPVSAPHAIRKIAVDHILPNPFQPRRTFHPERMNELAASIQTHGIVQPVLLRPGPDGKFEIVAGERRWRAARIAGLETVPAIVQEVSNERLLEIALVENIQREDLNPIEMAQAFEQLAHEFSLTHEQIAQRTGKDRATITNFLRLLKLTHQVQMLVAEGKLTMGHARALIGLSQREQEDIAKKIVAQGLSVRSTERMVARSKEPQSPPPTVPLDPNMRHAIQEMERALGTRVRIIEAKDGGGRIEIDYYTADDLERIYNHVLK
jgi:ParB family chromosome partitioning protein